MRGPLIVGALVTYVLSVTSQSIGDVVCYFPWGSPNMIADDIIMLVANNVEQRQSLHQC